MGMIIPSVAEWLDHSRLLNSKGVFISGTDTGVGKTWVGVHLVQLLRVLGREVIVRKPVEAGWAADVTQTDAWQLAQAAGLCPTLAEGMRALKTVCPYPLQAPLSPPRAAALEAKKLKMLDVVATCPTRISPSQFLFVEGAGGFCSPLTDNGLNADFAQILGLPVVIVTEDRLGALNQVLMVAEVLKHRYLQLAGVILNTREAPPPGMDNLTDLRELLNVPVMRFPQS